MLTPPTAIVRAEHLSKHYGKQCVVDEISFAIAPGEFCGILGPNGAGKTTTLKMLVGNTPSSAGDAERAGLPHSRQGTGHAHADRRGAASGQSRSGLYRGGEPAHLRPLFRAEPSPRSRTAFRALLSFAALEEKAGSRINQFSGGMRRRLSIARALINSPELLILDEPTTGLDPQIRQNIWQFSGSCRRTG